MPNPAEYDNKKDWMAACVPVRKEEGDKQDQAVATCLSIWRKHTGEPEPKAKATPSLEQQQRRIWEAWSATHRGGSDAPAMAEEGYVVETFDAYVIVQSQGAYWKVGYSDDGEVVTFAPQDKWRKVEQQTRWTPAKNALKAVSRTDDELRVGNYIVLFGGRDLEGIASENKNQDGSLGEFFTAETDLESAYTKAGMLYVDWEHGRGKELDGKDAPGEDDVLGVVDWSTAKADTRGVWVERSLKRRSQYVKFLEELIDAGLIGTSSQAVPDGIRKGKGGQIARWPLKRDTLTVQPMEPRMMKEYGDNHIQAFKALGILVPAQDDTAEDNTPAEAEPEGAKASASVAGLVRAKASLTLAKLLEEV